MKKVLIIVFIAVLVVTVGLVGTACKTGGTTATTAAADTTAAAKEKIVVGMAWPGMQDAVWSTSKVLLEELAAKSDPPIELIFTAADMDVTKQASDVKDLISKKVDVVLVFPIDSKAISASVKDCQDAGIPVMSFLRQVNADAEFQADVFVGIDAKWQLYSAAKTVAVFQVESSGMMDALKRMKPNCIEDIVASSLSSAAGLDPT